MKKISIKKPSLNIYATLIMFALIPMIIGIVASLVITLTQSSKQIKNISNIAMLSLTEGVGRGLDDHGKSTQDMLELFADNEAIVKFLSNPSDTVSKVEAINYTNSFFEDLEGWEGIYIADWNSTVMAHSTNPDIVGVKLREGEALAELQNAMLESSNGLYSAGVIISPSSGQLTNSMYCVVKNEKGNPIGYVGGGVFMTPEFEKYADVSSLDLSSAYLYAVNKEGTMIYHKNAEKIGNPVENEVVKGLVADLAEGKHPDPKCVEYKYKGEMKHAAYYVSDDNSYITVITADQKDILAEVYSVIKVAIIAAIVLIAIFVFIAIIITRLIATPLKKVSDFTKDLSNGDIKTDFSAKSHIKEITSIIEAAHILQTNLNNIVDNLKEVSRNLSVGASTTNDLCATSTDGANQISSAVEDIAQGSTQLAQGVEGLATQMDNISQSIDTIVDKTETLNNSSNDMLEISNEAEKDIKDVQGMSYKNVEGATLIKENMSELQAAVDEINKATELISNIADQTNLLSLNASIEAARAGEAGRGFSVVAGEIKTLSEQSNTSAQEIKDLVSNILEITQKSSTLVADIEQSILTEQEKVTNTIGSFTKLKTNIDNSIEEIENISKEVASLNSAKVSCMDTVNDLSAISEENSASSEEISANVTTLAGDIENILDKSTDINKMSEKLVEVTNEFH